MSNAASRVRFTWWRAVGAHREDVERRRHDALVKARCRPSGDQTGRPSGAVERQPGLAAAVGAHREDVAGRRAGRPHEGDQPPVGRPVRGTRRRRALSVSWRTSRPARVHRVDLGVVAVANARERDRRPFGDHAGSNSSDARGVGEVALVAAVGVHREDVVVEDVVGSVGSRSRPNTISRPSGDHAGNRSVSALNVICVGFDPSAFITNTSLSPSVLVGVGRSLTNTILRPSGRQLALPVEVLGLAGRAGRVAAVGSEVDEPAPVGAHRPDIEVERPRGSCRTGSGRSPETSRAPARLPRERRQHDDGCAEIGLHAAHRPAGR